jgi:hypothetical protein
MSNLPLAVTRCCGCDTCCSKMKGGIISEGGSPDDEVIRGGLPDFLSLGGRMMSGPEEQSLNEARRAEKRAAEEIEQLARDQARREKTLAREQAIEEEQKKREARRAEKRVAEEIEQAAKDRARRQANLAREQAIAEAEEARKLKAKKQPPH